MPGSEISRYDHLMAIAKQTGEDPEELHGPEFPEVISHVYEWFLELHSGRQNGPIGFSDIKAWSELTGRQITPFETRLIKNLDAEYLKQQHDNGRRLSRTGNKS